MQTGNEADTLLIITYWFRGIIFIGLGLILGIGMLVVNWQVLCHNHTAADIPAIVVRFTLAPVWFLLSYRGLTCIRYARSKPKQLHTSQVSSEQESQVACSIDNGI